MPARHRSGASGAPLQPSPGSSGAVLEWHPPLAGVLHLGSELEHRLGMHLADARLGDAQDLPDLGQGEALVAVEGDDDLLALAEPVDAPARMPFISWDSNTATGSSAPLSSRVSTRLRRSPRSEPADSSSSRATTDTNEIWLKIWCSSSVVMPSCWATSASVGLRCRRFSRGDVGLLDLAGLEPGRTRDPVDGSQLVDDRALDPRDRVRLELDAPFEVSSAQARGCACS
jgi:hypothetical protein